MTTAVNQHDAFPLIRTEYDDRYWRQVLTYGVEHNLQAVLDEYVHYLRDGSAASALAKASSSIYGLLKRTKDAGSREILTVAAQDEFVAPSHQFTPEAV